MASFFSNLFDKIQNVFKTNKLDDNIMDFQHRMDVIITDLILPYAEPPEKIAEKDRFRDLITLLDPKQCNKIAITMSNNLDKNYTKLQLEQFASNILIGRDKSDCNDETCSGNSVPSIDNKNKKVSKKEICNAIAVHYVKILNLISAVLTAVNPMDNICLNRLRNLLTIISEDEQKGISGICDPSADVVKQSIMHEPGFKELLMLYYYHLIQDTETEEEKTNVRNQYQIFIKTLSNLIMFVDPSLKDSPEMDAMVARELSNRNVNANEEENETENNQNNNVLENLDQESNNAKAQPSTNNIANIRKNISNFKANENAKLNNILSKIEGLNQIISNIQSNTKEKTLETPSTPMEPVPSPMEPVPSPMEPVPSPMEPVPSPMEPVPSPMEPVPSPMEPVSTPMEPVPTPMDPVATPMEPVPTPMEPVPVSTESEPSVLSEDLTDSDSDSESDDDDDDDEDDDDDLLDEIKDIANTNSTVPSTPTEPSMPSSSGMENTSAESVLPKTEPSMAADALPVASAENQTKSNNNQTKEINDLLNQINETQKGGADNDNMNNNNLNKKINNVMNNNMNNENNQNNLQKQNESVINTQELKTNNTLLDKFLEFVDFYSKIDDIDSKIIEIVNTAFKTYDKFSNETKMEADLRITEDDFDNFCINNINDNAQIPITLNDPRLTEYLKIYKDLKSLYLDNCEYLLTLLEKQVLVKEPSNDTNTKSRFTLREIGYADLAALETDVRNRLVNMYAQCQQNYQAGIKALYNALKEEVQN